MAVFLYRLVCIKKPSYFAVLFPKNQGQTSKSVGVRQLLIPRADIDTGLYSFQGQLELAPLQFEIPAIAGKIQNSHEQVHKTSSPHQPTSIEN